MPWRRPLAPSQPVWRFERSAISGLTIERDGQRVAPWARAQDIAASSAVAGKTRQLMSRPARRAPITSLIHASASVIGPSSVNLPVS